ncbi:MAG: ABC transporter ATP-binding protein [Candidatus Gracilibacteria bacterium]|jgi:ABC-2 type transport system ATP-binding protein|nr:ABC transporter ATP-binding protein [Candidatus Gracilibacteria bacterium]
MKVISIKKLNKNFKNNQAVKNLSLDIEKGEVFGFLGPNGAGKTTTIKMILNLLKPTSGEIFILGQKQDKLDIKHKIGFLPEHTYFYQHLTGEEFLQFTGQIFGLDPNTIKKRSKQLIKKVNLPKGAEKRLIKSYSKGMQQRIGLAHSLMNDPELVFLDEPMSGLDPVGRREVKDLILELKEQGKTVFFNSHILQDAEVLCDKIGIINKGKLVSYGTVKDLTKKGKITLEDYFVEIIGKKSATKAKKR